MIDYILVMIGILYAVSVIFTFLGIHKMKGKEEIEMGLYADIVFFLVSLFWPFCLIYDYIKMNRYKFYRCFECGYQWKIEKYKDRSNCPSCNEFFSIKMVR